MMMNVAALHTDSTDAIHDPVPLNADASIRWADARWTFHLHSYFCTPRLHNPESAHTILPQHTFLHSASALCQVYAYVSIWCLFQMFY